MLEIGKTYDGADRALRIKIIYKMENPSVYVGHPYAGVIINKAGDFEGAIRRFSADGRCLDSRYADRDYDIDMPPVSRWYNMYASRTMSNWYASERDAASGARPHVNARLELRWRGDELVEAIVHKVQS